MILPAVTVKARLKVPEKHRYRYSNSPAIDEKRRGLPVPRHDDLVEGIRNDKLEEIIADSKP